MAPGRPALGRRVVARWNTVSVFSFSHSQTAILLDLVDKGGGPSRPVPTPARSATLGSRRPMRDAADGFRSAAGPAFVPGGRALLYGGPCPSNSKKAQSGKNLLFSPERSAFHLASRGLEGRASERQASEGRKRRAGGGDAIDGTGSNVRVREALCSPSSFPWPRPLPSASPSCQLLLAPSLSLPLFQSPSGYDGP